MEEKGGRKLDTSSTYMIFSCKIVFIVDRHIFTIFLNFFLGKGRGIGINAKTHLYKNFKKISVGMADEKKIIIKSAGNFNQKF
jgi:hypothetical protein